jgi:hypothetical protein
VAGARPAPLRPHNGRRTVLELAGLRHDPCIQR